MSDIQREDSFRTALKNQKRRLSQTKLPSKPLPPDKTPVLAADLRAVMGPIQGNMPRRRQSRAGSLPEIKDLYSMADERDEDEADITKKRELTPQIRLQEEEKTSVPPTPPTTPTSSMHDLTLQRPQSPFAPKKPSPLVMDSSSRPETPPPPPPLQPPKAPSTRSKSPVPPDSPLLCHAPESPTVKRARELRRAGSFRRSMERSRERSKTPVPQPEPAKVKVEEEVSFCIRKHMGGRQGWKIMPESATAPLKAEALKRVVTMIKEMELNGHQIPERITIKV